MDKVVTKESHEKAFSDRTNWGAGPWDKEQDRYEWKTAAGLPGMILRGPVGALCGYVAVTEGHPCFGRDYISEYEPGADGEPDYAKPLPNPVDDLNVHGGITYGDRCSGKICHVPAPGEPDNVWWLGFDCAHSGDLCPSTAAILRKSGMGLGSYEQYRDVEYVRAEVESLAEQLAGLGRPTASSPDATKEK